MGPVIITGPRDFYNAHIADRLARHWACENILTADVMVDLRRGFALKNPLIFTSIKKADLEGLIDVHGNPVLVLDSETALEGVRRDPVPAAPMMQTPDFWLVWSPDGRTPPRYRHYTQAAAEREAIRLSALNPSTEFFVLEPRIKVATPAPKIVRYERALEDEMPF